MTTEELEQLMRAHKCGFSIQTMDNEGDQLPRTYYGCELVDGHWEVIGQGFGDTIVEAVYEALKSKCGQDTWSDTAKWIYSESKKP